MTLYVEFFIEAEDGSISKRGVVLRNVSWFNFYDAFCDYVAEYCSDYDVSIHSVVKIRGEKK